MLVWKLCAKTKKTVELLWGICYNGSIRMIEGRYKYGTY